MVTVRPAAASELRRVLRLTLGAPGMSWAQLERQIDTFQQYARLMNLDLSHHWVAHNGPEWLSVASFVESPGRTAMVFLSNGFDDPPHRDATVQLLGAVEQFARQRAVRLTQCLLDPSDRPPISVSEAGYRPLARLEYLDRAISAPSPPVRRPPGSDYVWQTYSETVHALFAETILATYQESRDCAGLSGLREIDEIIAGHKAATRFDPSWWLLLSERGMPLGCLLMGEVPLRNAAEIVYMGLRPGARGRGLSRMLLAKALEVARGGARSGFPYLILPQKDRRLEGRTHSFRTRAAGL
jgi:mycothiol synthase